MVIMVIIILRISAITLQSTSRGSNPTIVSQGPLGLKVTNEQWINGASHELT